MIRALIVFHGAWAWRWQRLLRPGFRHVFCVVDDGAVWIALDGRAGTPSIRYVAPSDYDAAGWFRALGYTVVPWRISSRRAAPLVAGTCVGMVKAMLGIRSWALTPWQLFRWTERNGGPEDLLDSGPDIG